MAEIFLSYILSSVDFIFKIAVVAFVAKQFGWISGPKFLETKETTSSQPNSRSATSKSQAPNPLGDIFGNILQQMAPMMQGSLQKDSKQKVPMNFSDEVVEEVEPEVVETSTPVTN